MPLAFVLIDSKIEANERTLKEITLIPYVKEAYLMHGVCDIVAKVEADSMLKLKEIISKIRSIDKVRSTLSLYSYIVIKQ